MNFKKKLVVGMQNEFEEIDKKAASTFIYSQKKGILLIQYNKFWFIF